MQKSAFVDFDEWVRVEGDTAFVGISDYAQDSLGDIVFIELPDEGKEVKRGDEVTTIESVKAASPIFAPVSGVLSRVNSDLNSTPELVNQKPYESFLFAITMSDPSEVSQLLDSTAYGKIVEEEKASH